MKQISVSSFATTGLEQAFGTVRTIELEDNPIGQGGFGEVYRAFSVDARRNSGQVIKILFDTGNNAAARGFATIQELQKRLRRQNEELLKTTRRSLIDHYPALAGVPQFSFEGTLNGRKVVGYSSNNLVAAGMEDFGRVLEDDSKTRQFQALPISSRIMVALQLVRAFHFLSSQILFIHADIKAEAIFVDFTKLRCAIIDFDSGAVAKDASDKPTTFGTNQDWLAPEISKQLAAPGNAARIIKVDLLSDLWAINIAIHYLLFGFHPLFFLSEISDRSIAEYFRQFQWPAAAPSFKYFRKDLEPVYRQYVSILRSMVPAEVVRQLSFTINRGYTDPTSRATCGQWKTVLDVLNRPAIVRFSADRTALNDPRPVRLSWEVSGASRLEIPGVGEVTSRTSIEVEIRRDTTIELVLTPSHGSPIRKSVQIQVSKAPPSIHAFTTSAQLLDRPNPARLAWSVAGAERIEIDNGVGDVSGRSFTGILPKTDTTYTLTATSPFGVVARASVKIEVSKVPPAIHHFWADRAVLCDARPVELSWKVCERAHEVRIDGIGVVPREGSLRVSQKKDQVYVLRARSAFGYSSESRCRVEVSKVAPRIEVFSADPMFLREGMETEIRWRITGADRTTILPKIGSVPSTGQVKVRLTQEAQFSLATESYYGVRAAAALTIRVLKPRTFDAGRVNRLNTDGARTLNTAQSRPLSRQVHPLRGVQGLSIAGGYRNETRDATVKSGGDSGIGRAGK
jgi:serine/threonine protein kinase